MMTTTENAIEQVGTLRIERSEIDSGVAFVKIWRGKAERPYANYRFRNVAAREAYIAEQVEAAERAAAWKEERKAARAAKTAEMCELIRVGCILHYSWGYEQTQCEFYQVIAKAGRKVTIRRIASKTVEGSEGFDSDRRQPVRAVPDQGGNAGGQAGCGAYRQQQGVATITAEAIMSDISSDRIAAFLADLSDVSRRHGLALTACGCCNHISVYELDESERQDDNCYISSDDPLTAPEYYSGPDTGILWHSLRELKREHESSRPRKLRDAEQSRREKAATKVSEKRRK